MIGKGCTCENTFSIPFVESDIAAIRITYGQKNKVLFEKELEDCMFEDGEVTVRLEQEDTLKFDDSQIIEIQLKIKLGSGSVIKSNIIQTYTDRVLCNEVI